MSSSDDGGLAAFLAARYADEWAASRDYELRAGLGESRATRDVDAKREILAQYARALEKAPGNLPLISTLIRLMRAQAAIWCDHPDYRPEWKP